jgi:putative flippase GtrA
MLRNNLLISLFTKLMAKHHVKTKFVLVGGWNTIFGYGVFCLLDTVFSYLFSPRYIAYMSAMVLGRIIAVINAYIFHKYITFKSTVRGKGIIIEFFRFSMTYVVTFCLSLILLPFFVEIYHITPKISVAIIILICTIISYLGHSRFSFKLE